MSDKSTSNKQVSASLQDALKALRPTLRRAMELSDHDVSAVIVEPILTGLGWDVRNPKQARRPSGVAAINLILSNKTAITVRSVPSLEDVPKSLTDIDQVDGDWIVITNGQDWNIFHQTNPANPVQSLTIKDAPSQKEAAPILSMLERDAFQKDGMSQAWMSEAVDQSVSRVLARHLDGSKELVEVINSGLTDAGIQIPDNEIRAALSRIEISLGNTPVSTGSQEASQETETPAPAKRGRPRKNPEAAPAKRGRPKKAVGTATAPAKRGRPKKNTETPTAEQAQASSGKTTTASKKPTKSKASKSTKAKNPLPSSPEDIGWPDDATHVMQRKKNIVFIKHDASSNSATILPGSLITEKLGKSLSAPLKQVREDAAFEGKMEEFGHDMLRVKDEIEFKSPQDAASFGAATFVKDLSAWKDQKGAEMEEAKPKKASAKKSAPKAKEETAPTPAVASDPEVTASQPDQSDQQEQQQSAELEAIAS